MKRRHLRKVGSLTAVVMLTSSCASLHQAGENYGTAIGCIGGAALGGGITYLVTKDATKAVAGGLIGGIAGCMAGNVWQSREKALAQIAAEEHIAIRSQPLQAQQKSGTETVGLVAQVEDSGMFDTNSAQLSASGLRQVRKIAAVMKEGDQNGVVLIVGHTDATGSASWNQKLSEQRAQNVGRILQQAGLNPQKLYFQGAGSSRPLADNTTYDGRAANRRVEIVGLANETLLRQRVEQEGNNLAYLRYGTQPAASQQAKSTSAPAPAKRRSVEIRSAKKEPSSTPAAQSQETATVSTVSENNKNWVDFGGQAVSASTLPLAANLKPRSSGFSLISQANASGVTGSCLTDNARVAGAAKNLASGKALDDHQTREYFNGMNGRAWAGLVNNHLVTLSPVKVLKDNAAVVANPNVYITRNYQSSDNRKADAPISAVANAWEGEDSILYRVYLPSEKQQPLSCIDLLVPKNATKAQQGQLFYTSHSNAWVANYSPTRS
ncbi:OmpA family protein [Mixta hanseatica]|uniref:OmpA family protein n=2 Tax=Mixta hanseatica TaxID=2872648 RepID=A0ABY4R8E3_9GAMM|nr:OmpA family protein [Mixta hanseatica]